MHAASAQLPPVEPTSPHVPRAGDELVRVRAGAWRLLVPMRHVARVLGAAMPAAHPSPPPALRAPVVALGGELVPVLFAGTLLGAAQVRLAPEHQMVLLSDGPRRALLWVDAVEDVVEHAPVDGPARAGIVAGWSGPERPLAVLDVPRLLELAAGEPQAEESR